MRNARLFAWLTLAGCIPELPDVDRPCGEWPDPGLYQFSTDTPEKTRRSFVYVPASSGERELVVVLHGGGDGARPFSDVTGHFELADREGFVAVFPNGLRSFLPRVWNAGPCCGSVDDAHRDIDDVAYLDQLVDELSPKVCGGPVLATGFSNGAMMAHRWACEGARVDAVVPVSGGLLTDRCAGPPKPVRHYHGLADTNVAFGGSASKTGRNTWPPVEDGLALWRTRNRCDDSEPIEVTYGPVTCTAWRCEEAVEMCLIDGWGHTWPGGVRADQLPRGVDATQNGLDFLRGARLTDLAR